ncbi:MAG: hypothetical protein ACX93O_07695 [Flagellimonas sp.]
MKFILFFSLLIMMSCSNRTKSKETTSLVQNQKNLIAVLDTIWTTEQLPIRSRDSLIELYGVDHDLVKEQNITIDKNHAINEEKVKTILDKYGWPTKEMAGERGNWTICNVIQHSDNEV